MADASDTDVVQEVSKILASSDVVVESLIFELNFWSGALRLEMTYHRCKADSNDDQLEEPEVEGDVEREWSLSRVDGLKELLPAIVKSTNLKAISWGYGLRYPDVIESLLQGLYTNHTIVMASFTVSMNDLVPNLMDKFVVMLCHNTSLKAFSLATRGGIGEHSLPISGFGKALGMNHTLEILNLISLQVDLEELVQPLIMDENGNQVNSTLTTLQFSDISFIMSSGASIAGMLRRNSSIKHLRLKYWWDATESDIRELILPLANNHSLETLSLFGSSGVKGTVFHAIMDVLLINFTLNELELYATSLYHRDKHMVINNTLKKNAAAKKLHLMELEMAEPTSARVIFCGSPYAGMSPISIGPITNLHQFVFHLKLDVFT
jgi:hypothetical protein